MARKSQEIKVVVHMPIDIAGIFTDKRVEGFWTEKIQSKVEEANLTEDERKALREFCG